MNPHDSAPKKVQNIRFGRSGWELIVEQARREGVTPSQYVRDAATAMMLYQRNRRRPEK